VWAIESLEAQGRFTAQAGDATNRFDATSWHLAHMTFHKTKIPGVVEIHPEPMQDDRGFFARTWCKKEFQQHGLNPVLAQCNISFNKRKGTLRGLHYQAKPFQEAKLVRCTQGAIHDVVVDLRAESPAFKSWVATVLTCDNRHMLYVPEGCAHGFLTLEDETEVFYQMSEYYNADSARGVRWNDAAFRIHWPAGVDVISERDRTYPDFK
jgi:dTDP-4-dehydrorhamnose 3,5-epimerase